MPGSAHDEDEQERLNRELIELLNELRVALPGVQVLFAFLLTVPFTNRFARLDAFDRDVYFVTLLLAAAATALLIAPSAHHRVLFRQGEKPALLQLGNRLALAGIGCLALAMSGAILLITRVLFDGTAAAIVAGAAALVFVALWYLLPLALRLRR